MTICYSPWSMLTEGKGALPAILFLFDFRSSLYRDFVQFIKRLSLTVLIQECISSGEIGFGEFGSMEEVASLRPVSLIYLSVLHARFHLQQSFCLTRFNLPVKSTISGHFPPYEIQMTTYELGGCRCKARAFFHCRVTHASSTRKYIRCRSQEPEGASDLRSQFT